jgi:hypothetical protein
MSQYRRSQAGCQRSKDAVAGKALRQMVEFARSFQLSLRIIVRVTKSIILDRALFIILADIQISGSIGHRIYRQ